MSWILDNVPWWVYLVVLGGGGGALLAFVPGALAFVLTVYRMLPPWMRWAIAGVGAVALAYLGGRNRGRRNAHDEQKIRDARAVQKRQEVENNVKGLSDDEVDKQLRNRGDFREGD